MALAGCGDGRRRSVTAPEIPAGDLAMNVHPLGGSVGALQRQALRQLGSSWIRVTLGLTAGTDAARAYTQAAPNVLGVVADTRFDTLDAATWPDRLEAVLRRFPEVRRAQLLNEPDVFNGLSPARYVREFLRAGARCSAEVVPEPAPQSLVDLERFCDVVPPRQHLHQQAVAALAVRRFLDKRARCDRR